MTITTSDAAPAVTGGIRKIPRDRTAPRAQKKENLLQVPLGFALVAVVFAIGVYIYAAQGSLVLSINWFIGVLLGLALQRSRFCFTAAFRDPVLTGGTSLSKAVVFGLAAATVVFAALQLGAFAMAPEVAMAMAAAM